jgi:predicted  nucleic acid-binding Zn-ribbon protein
MDVTTGTDPQDKPSAYTTSKQVQAWFLRRSRDLWKQKYAELKIQSKRLQQQVADVSESRANWRGETEIARREAQELRAKNADLQARLDALARDAQKKIV